MTGLLEAVGIGDSSATVTEQLVIERIRLPRIVLAMLVGAALGISGAAMQSLFRNPLADPGKLLIQLLKRSIYPRMIFVNAPGLPIHHGQELKR